MTQFIKRPIARIPLPCFKMWRQDRRDVRQQLVQQTTPQRLGAVDSNELVLLKAHLVCDEGIDGYGQRPALAQRERERTLLAIDYPCRLRLPRSGQRNM